MVPALSPQQRVDARQELVETKWLGNVIVRADAKAVHLVRLTRACGEHEHGRLESFVPKRAQHAKAVDSREHDVEDDDIGFVTPRGEEAALAIGRRGDDQPVPLEIVPERIHHVGIVLDDEHSARRVDHALVPAPASTTEIGWSVSFASVTTSMSEID